MLVRSRVRCASWACSRPVATIAFLLAAGACTATAPSEPRQTLRYLAWTSQGFFARNMVTRFSSIPNVTLVTEETPGSSAVISMLEQGHGDFGFSLADVAYVAYQRSMESDQQPRRNVRAIAVRWPNTMTVAVAADSPIRRIEELAGKRVGIVPVGAAGEMIIRLVLQEYGLKYSDFQPVFIEIGAMADSLKDGRLDAAVALSFPVSNLSSGLRQSSVRRLSLRQDVITRIRSRYPFVKSVSEAGSTPGVRNIQTVGVDSLLVCRRDLSEPLVYEMTKAFFELLKDVARAEPAAGIELDQVSATPLPLHPGAARYYREREILK